MRSSGEKMGLENCWQHFWNHQGESSETGAEVLGLFITQHYHNENLANTLKKVTDQVSDI